MTQRVVTVCMILAVLSACTAQSLQLTSPIGGVSRSRGFETVITWTSAGISNVRIQFWNNNIGFDTLIAEVTASTPASTGTYTWTIPPTTPVANDYYFYICSTTGAPCSQGSDISIDAKTLAVTAPLAGASVTIGQPGTVTWSSSGITNVKIEIFWTLVPQLTPPDSIISLSTAASVGRFTLTVPTVDPVDRNIWFVRVCDTTGNPCATGPLFTISAAQTTPPAKSLTVTAPGSGVTLIPGDSASITWTSSGITDVRIRLFAGSGNLIETIAATTPSDGNFLWTVSSQIPGSDFYIEICDSIAGTPCRLGSKFTIGAKQATGSGKCFHKDTIITYGGMSYTFAEIQAHPSCSIPHIVQAQGVVVTARCANLTRILRVTEEHLVYTQRGLEAAGYLIPGTDTLYADLAESFTCMVVNLTQETHEHEYFGLNCISSQVLASGLKSSTFEKLHSVPALWMQVAGYILGIEQASKVGDYIAELAKNMNLI